MDTNTTNWQKSPEAIRQNDMSFCGALREYYIKKFRRVAANRRKKLANIKNYHDAANYIKNVRNCIKKHFKFPAEKSDLMAPLS